MDYVEDVGEAEVIKYLEATLTTLLPDKKDEIREKIEADKNKTLN